jgi:hypothetical protein
MNPRALHVPVAPRVPLAPRVPVAPRALTRLLSNVPLLALVSLVSVTAACNGPASSPTSRAKQCFFDPECISSQRCLRKTDDIMGVCVDRGPSDAEGGAPAQSVAPSGPADGGAPSPAPQPGEIAL